MLDITRNYNDCFRMLFKLQEQHIVFEDQIINSNYFYIEKNNKINVSEVSFLCFVNNILYTLIHLQYEIFLKVVRRRNR